MLNTLFRTIRICKLQKGNAVILGLVGYMSFTYGFLHKGNSSFQLSRMKCLQFRHCINHICCDCHIVIVIECKQFMPKFPCHKAQAFQDAGLFTFYVFLLKYDQYSPFSGTIYELRPIPNIQKLREWLSICSHNFNILKLVPE